MSDDEAHCIVQWGSFRFDYSLLSKFQFRVSEKVVFHVDDAIIEPTNIGNGYISSFDEREGSRDHQTLKWLVEYTPRRREDSGAESEPPLPFLVFVNKEEEEG